MENISEVSKKQLLEARKPFDSALEAINSIETNRDYILDILMRCFMVMSSDYENRDYRGISKILKCGEFPKVWNIDGNLRIESQLNQKDSLLHFLETHTVVIKDNNL